ncbi:MAG: electron transfer flavoprotein subunit beta/FixA family protein, partial [Bacteroidota bacterium]
MPYNSIVCVKQVPDTSNISGQVMKPDGTVNRAKLPTIFNPDDLVALELALQVRDCYGGKVWVITMGPPPAAEVLRQALYMGADEVALISDRRFAAADTLATSYALSMAIRKIGNVDLVFCGRQAIDGDTAQVGPQLAEKLSLAQVTYAEKIEKIEDNWVYAKRKIEGGYERVRAKLPVLVTVMGDAAVPRPFNAKFVMEKKRAQSRFELERMSEDNPFYYYYNDLHKLEKKGLLIPTWTIEDINAEE